MPNLIYTILHPSMYHGHRAKPPFFEGWYYKLVDESESRRFAIIPGVILGKDAHAFIQILDGVTGGTEYHRYPIDAFEASQSGFHLRIGENEFTRDYITLDIDRYGASIESPVDHSRSLVDLKRISGSLRFKGVTPWPVSLSSPGIMGWYAWMPFMECYHGVVSLDHSIHGTLSFGDENIDFTNGRGYIEKDWGQSFPEAWVWFQSNHFQAEGTCLTASVATIPWLGSAFRGFIIGLWHNKKLYRFATYNRARVESLEIYPDRVEWVIKRKDLRLSLMARRTQGGLIKGPTRLEMDKRVVETLNAQVETRLIRASGEVLFEGTGLHAGLEVHNTTSFQNL
jgi:tocopherol cyclase